MNKYCVLSMFLFFSFLAISQNSNDFLYSNNTAPENNDTNKVQISQDIRVDELLSNHIEQNRRKEGVNGVRIRIYSNLGNSARDDSQAAKARFYELFPEIPIYREYDSPYFKVYVGDYRTKIDALTDFKKIKRYFPAAFIVPDKINYPEL